jgi:hypothetical protein
VSPPPSTPSEPATPASPPTPALAPPATPSAVSSNPWWSAAAPYVGSGGRCRVVITSGVCFTKITWKLKLLIETIKGRTYDDMKAVNEAWGTMAADFLQTHSDVVNKTALTVPAFVLDKKAIDEKSNRRKSVVNRSDGGGGFDASAAAAAGNGADTLPPLGGAGAGAGAGAPLGSTRRRAGKGARTPSSGAVSGHGRERSVAMAAGGAAKTGAGSAPAAAPEPDGKSAAAGGGADGSGANAAGGADGKSAAADGHGADPAAQRWGKGAGAGAGAGADLFTSGMVWAGRVRASALQLMRQVGSRRGEDAVSFVLSRGGLLVTSVALTMLLLLYAWLSIRTHPNPPTTATASGSALAEAVHCLSALTNSGPSAVFTLMLGLTVGLLLCALCSALFYIGALQLRLSKIEDQQIRNRCECPLPFPLPFPPAPAVLIRFLYLCVFTAVLLLLLVLRSQCAWRTSSTTPKSCRVWCRAI